MEIHVTENAVNSLEVGLDFYNRFLDNLDSLDISVSHFGGYDTRSRDINWGFMFAMKTREY
ncbi:hypothetical protein [Hathewaya massiliensis]|uniref:hypothetical protein n=1 Tax=Hathewaya massiliensis TaxID=1964382 RepID=UPI00115B6D83|nr:hypothetical protein [Hathewaya massiliensis]